MDLEAILQDYGQQRGINNLSLDEQGVCRLKINDTCIVSIEKSLDCTGFFIYAAIGHFPAGKKKELSIRALQGNLFGRETGSASLGYTAKSNTLVLFEYLHDECTDTTYFTEKLSRFIQYLSYWNSKMKEEAHPPLEEVSLQKHIQELKSHGDVQIFFA